MVQLQFQLTAIGTERTVVSYRNLPSKVSERMSAHSAYANPALAILSQPPETGLFPLRHIAYPNPIDVSQSIHSEAFLSELWNQGLTRLK